MGDYNNIKKLTTFLKEDLKQIDIFLVMYKEDNPRFVGSMQNSLNVFTSIFGDTFWKNMATEFTFWSYDQEKMKRRYNARCREGFELKTGGQDLCVDTSTPTLVSAPEYGYEDSDPEYGLGYYDEPEDGDLDEYDNHRVQG